MNTLLFNLEVIQCKVIQLLSIGHFSDTAQGCTHIHQTLNNLIKKKKKNHKPQRLEDL